MLTTLRRFAAPALLAVALGMSGPSLAAGYIVSSATVTMLTSTASNLTAFVVATTGGTGSCTGGAQITFNQSDSPDADTFKRAYAALLMAFTTGAKVSIYNYQDNTCNHASYVQLGP